MNPTAADHEPLDPQEQTLARIVRALPAGEPSAGVDARLLRAASDAVAAARPRRLAWLATSGPLWSIGSAAAAVLAIGVAWQVYSPVPKTLAPTSPVPVSAPLDHDAPLPVEFRDRVAPQVMPGPPSAAAPAVAPARAPAAAARKPAPAIAPARNALDEAVLRQSTPVPAAPAVTAQAQDAAPAAALAAPMAKSASTESSAERTAGALADAPAFETPEATLARVRADARRYPESWLLKVRARRDDGDLTGARASLQLFHRTYPSYPLPEDLRPLLAP